MHDTVSVLEHPYDNKTSTYPEDPSHLFHTAVCARCFLGQVTHRIETILSVREFFPMPCETKKSGDYSPFSRTTYDRTHSSTKIVHVPCDLACDKS